jgi:uncharacterized membrane protein
MQSDKERIEQLEESYRKLWAEHEDLKARIKENYAEFKSLRDGYGVKPAADQTVSKVISPKQETPVAARPAEIKQSIFTPKKSTDWEKFIGEQLLSKIGLLVLLIGLIIGTKYAIDHNWLSIGVRIVGTYAIAGVLGFFAFRFKEKYRSFSAVLASGAVSVSYFITYAAFSWYHVIPFSLSFAGLLVCVIAAVYLAWYYNLVIIAHFGLIAAYVLPPLISTSNQHLSYYLAYMLVINLGMLAISLLKNWSSIRVPVLIWSNVIFIAWFFVPGLHYHPKTDWLVATVYCLLFFLSFHISAILPSILRKEKLPVASFGEIIPVTFVSYSILRYILWAADGSLATLLLFAVLVCAYFAFWVYEGIKRSDSVLREVHLILIAGVTIITICLDSNIHFQSVYMLLLTGAGVFVLIKYQKEKYDIFVLLALIVASGMFLVRQLATASIETYYSTITVTALLFCFILLALCIWNFKTAAEKSKYSTQQFLPYITFGMLLISIANQIHAWFSFEHSEMKAANVKFEKWYFDEVLASQAAMILGIGVLLLAVFFVVRKFVLKLNNWADLTQLFVICSLILLVGFSMLSYFSINTYVAHSDYFPSYNTGRYFSFFGILGIFYLLMNQKDNAKNTIVWFSLATLWILSLELSQWSIVFGFGAGYKIVLTLLWVTFSIGMIYRGLIKNSVLLRSTAMAILGISLVKLFFYDLIHLSTITKVVVFMLVGALLLVGAYFYQRIAKTEAEELKQ